MFTNEYELLMTLLFMLSSFIVGVAVGLNNKLKQ